MPRRIYVDLDDVLCATARALIDIAAREFGKRVALEDVTTFNLETALGLTPEQGRRLMDLVHGPSVLKALEPVDGALHGIAELTQHGFEVWVVTGRPPSTDASSRAWLTRHRIPFQSFIHVDKYHRADPDESSVETVSVDELIDYGFVLAVEDSAEFSTVLAERCNFPVALLDRPWNRIPEVAPHEESGVVQRCAGWSDAVRIARSLG